MNWPQLAYQYGFGGLFFAITLLLCVKRGAVDTKAPSDRKAVKMAVFGFFGYLLVHTAWILAVTP